MNREKGLGFHPLPPNLFGGNEFGGLLSEQSPTTYLLKKRTDNARINHNHKDDAK